MSGCQSKDCRDHNGTPKRSGSLRPERQSLLLADPCIWAGLSPVVQTALSHSPLSTLCEMINHLWNFVLSLFPSPSPSPPPSPFSLLYRSLPFCPISLSIILSPSVPALPSCVCPSHRDRERWKEKQRETDGKRGKERDEEREREREERTASHSTKQSTTKNAKTFLKVHELCLVVAGGWAEWGKGRDCSVGTKLPFAM